MSSRSAGFPGATPEEQKWNHQDEAWDQAKHRGRMRQQHEHVAYEAWNAKHAKPNEEQWETEGWKPSVTPAPSAPAFKPHPVGAPSGSAGSRTGSQGSQQGAKPPADYPKFGAA